MLQRRLESKAEDWIPAFAGMTAWGVGRRSRSNVKALRGYCLAQHPEWHA